MILPTYDINICTYNPRNKLEQVIRETKMVGYGLGCEGPRNGCLPGKFDCSGIITHVLRKTGLYSQTGRKLTTSTFDTIGQRIPYTQAQYGDFVIMKADPNYNNNQHLAFIIEGWNGKSISILDWFQTKKGYANVRQITPQWIKSVIRIDY